MARVEKRRGRQGGQQLPDADQEAFRKVLLYDRKRPFALSEKIEKHYPAAAVAELKTLREEVAALKKSMPQFPANEWE